MENLDLLIAKFKEVKEELQKADSTPLHDTAEKEELEKYFSPFSLFGASKKVKPAVKEGPAKPTGIDKIKAVSHEKIQPTSVVSEDRKRAAAMGAPSNPTKPKLTGLDRIKAESQKPIEATTIKKGDKITDPNPTAPSPPPSPRSSDFRSGPERARDILDAHWKQQAAKPLSHAERKLATAPTAPDVHNPHGLSGKERPMPPVVKPFGKEETAVPPKKQSSCDKHGHVSTSNGHCPDCGTWSDKKSEEVKKAIETKLTHPDDSTRANMFHDAMHGAYTPPVVPKVATPPAKKLTGLDRIKAEQQKPILKGEQVNKAGEKLSFSKLGQWGLDRIKQAKGSIQDSSSVAPYVPMTSDEMAAHKKIVAAIPPKADPDQVNTAAEKPGAKVDAAAHAPTVISPTHIKPQMTDLQRVLAAAPRTRMGKSEEKLRLNKGGQWSLEKSEYVPGSEGEYDWKKRGPGGLKIPTTLVPPAPPVKKAEDLHDEKGRCTSCGSKSCDGADCKVDHSTEAIQANTKHNEGFKNKIKGLCPKCHAKKCQCHKEGILIDKSDGGLVNTTAAAPGTKGW
jgi:hypothetical protein